jgi:recombinational DNA repair protein RecR
MKIYKCKVCGTVSTRSVCLDCLSEAELKGIC